MLSMGPRPDREPALAGGRSGSETLGSALSGAGRVPANRGPM